MNPSYLFPLRSRRPALLALAAGLTAATTDAATILRLGDLPGGPFYSYATGISADGSAVSGFSLGTTSLGPVGYETFRWTPATGTVGLGQFVGGSPDSRGLAISGDGATVVGYGFRGGNNEAAVWTGGGMTGLGDLPGGTSFSQAKDVSANGSVVVGFATSAVSTEAFRWTAGSGMVSLGSLPGGSNYSEAHGVSDDGSMVVGGSSSTSSGIYPEAFLWTAGTGMTGLGDLPGGTTFSVAYDLSADGSVVVGRSDSSSGLEAFRWTAGSGMVSLGDLAGGVHDSYALGVSADGSVIVGFGNGDNGNEAFLWTPGLGMRSVFSLLVDLGVDMAEWEQLAVANDLSSDGRYVVGTGVRFGNTEAFRVDLGENWQAQFQSDVPEPSTYAAGLAALGIAGGAWWGGRRQRG